MPSGELLYQKDMFSGEWVDNRTSRQKKQDRERELPKPLEMFSQRELAQFGVNAHPLLPLSEHTKLGLIFEDPRTEEQRELDRQKEAEARTHQLFEGPDEPENRHTATPDAETLALVVYEAPCLALTVIEQVSRAVVVWEPVGDI
jgi:hypothetical protein